MDQFQRLEKRVTQIKPGLEERIIFFNIGEGNRSYLASLMDSIFDCSEIKGKIAYMGYFGSTNEDHHYTLSR